MGSGGGGNGRNRQLEERDLRFCSNDDHQRRQHNKCHFIEHRQAEDQTNNDYRQLHIAQAEARQQRMGNLMRRPGINHQLTDDRPEYHDNRQFTQRAAKAGFHGVQQLH